MVSEVERSNALEALDADVYANSSRTAQASLWKTIQAALARFGLSPFPPSVDSVEALGAALKAGAYASSVNYLIHYRLQCDRAGCAYSPLLNRIHADTVRSCKRGMGAPVKAMALPLMELGKLDMEVDVPWVAGGP